MTKSHDAVIMALDPKDMLEELKEKYGFSLKELAKELHISMRTLYRLQKGQRVSTRVIADIVIFYCSLASVNT